MGGLLYTEDQIEWIKANRNKYPDPYGFVRDFNQLFGVNRTLTSISDLCRHRKLVRSNFRKLPDTEKHIGETKKMACGLTATIIAWRTYNDIDVRFDNGFIKEHTSYSLFKSGKMTTKTVSSADELVQKYLHEKKMMNCGYECEIVAIRSMKDIDVQWHEGTVTEHRTYNDFSQGKIRVPAKVKWMHQKAVMNCGLDAEIVEFHSTSDILVRFEDGYETHSTTASWTHRTVDNPNVSNIGKKTSRAGERKMMKSGLFCTITEYRGINDIDVMFDDSLSTCNVTYTNFIKGSINHPLMLKGGHYTSRDFHGYILEGRVFLTDNDALYKVITPDGDKELLYISSIIERIKAMANAV